MRGFTLTEVLISLSLITITCLGLFRQQSQSLHWFNMQQLYWQANTYLVSGCSYLKSGLPLPSIPAPFSWQNSAKINLQWHWQGKLYYRELPCSMIAHKEG